MSKQDQDLTCDTVSKTIPPARDRLQSRLLVVFAVAVLCYAALTTLSGTMPFGAKSIGSTGRISDTWQPSAVSLLFALAVWRLKAATAWAAACGGLICLLMTQLTHSESSNIVASALTPLVLLFLFTFVATKWAAQRKRSRSGQQHSRRNAAQVIANLGVAGFFGSMAGMRLTASRAGHWEGDLRAHIGLLTLPMLAALVEATADTVSSEIGQAFGGTPFLITTFRRVPPGTDGAITLVGTVSGISASALVAVSAIPAIGTVPRHCLLAFISGLCGLFFDSLLGATLERKGLLGNDLVNFLSTAFASSIALVGVWKGWF
jgi:uncharacterized protein (TIGR00297 family)